jgi:hypothetical protein
MVSEKPKAKRVGWRKPLLIAALFVGVLITWWWLISGRSPLAGIGNDLSPRADAVAALFSALAFAAVVVALWLQRGELALQRKELTLQRKELRMTRVELNRSAAAQEKSEAALTKQADSLLMAAKLTAVNAIVNARTDIEQMRQAQQAQQSQGLTPFHVYGSAQNASAQHATESDLQLLEIYLYDILKASPGNSIGHGQERSFVGKGYLEILHSRTSERFRNGRNLDGTIDLGSACLALDYLANQLTGFLNQKETGDYRSRQMLESRADAATRLREAIHAVNKTPKDDERDLKFIESARMLININSLRF